MQTSTVHILDLHFLGSTDTIAAFLLPSTDGWVLVETGPYSTFATLRRAIEGFGIQLTDIQHVFITHIHFDHAGAAWAFAAQGATIYVHPSGKKHLHEPSKLYESARRIYQDKMDELWGKMEEIPLERLVTVEHEEVITIGNLHFRALHTPGHAIHHIAWQLEDAIFTGDVGGVKINDGLVVAPCPPPDIQVEDWVRSIEIIRNANPKTLYLTHFGKVTQVTTHLAKLEAQLLDWSNWMKPYAETNVNIEEVTPLFTAYTASQLEAAGITNPAEIEKYEKANPSWMSVSGLMRYWNKKLSKH
jgi:glyoxylase-like metal-dependent hydrolase (beta-lactamase superfamily II)